MQCPICNVDLSELDLVSRHEHVELCVENGPSVLVANESGRLVVQSKLAPAKQRKICPICSKTFQSLHTHFKTCALKNDLPPNLMLEYWDKINLETNCTKKFPKDLLDKFIAKCIKEGRVGEQVDFARALLISMVESEPQSINGGNRAQTYSSLHITESSNESTIIDNNSTLRNQLPTATTLLMLNATQQKSSAPTATSRQQQKNKPKHRIELVDNVTKEANIRLRIDRELAATRKKRYEEALLRVKAVKETTSAGGHFRQFKDKDGGEDNDDDDDCIVLDEQTSISATIVEQTTDVDFTKLFHKSRLKKCNNSTYCLMGECKQDHNIRLIIDGFDRFTLPLDLNKSDKSPEKVNCESSEKSKNSPNDSNQKLTATISTISCDTKIEEVKEKFQEEEVQTSGIGLDNVSAISSCPLTATSTSCSE